MQIRERHRQSLLLTIHGIVQGVGFRPFVYRLAHRLGLTGTVSNSGDGVVIHVAGRPDDLATFTRCLQDEAPPVARIMRLDQRPTSEPPPCADFRILPSVRMARPRTQIAPDIAVCDDCLAEIHDPANRRFGYPFTNCTNCGPRFSIVTGIPYDRPNTSMAAFTLCDACSREYHDPLDRRFHAQPNACPHCGPRLSWHDGEGRAVATADCIAAAALALAEGRIVAIKGLGGFHLAADAGSEAAVALLRQRKHRPGKPLAVMVRDLDTASRYARITREEVALLNSPEHPIVLVDRAPDAPLAQGVAPGISVLGLMLAYTPLHHLLLSHPLTPAALVMTSGNRSDEPICTGNQEALERLAGVADCFLLHNRDIVTRVDDSVARIMAGKTRLLRRARGFSPVPLLLRQPTTSVLACGAEMKNAFCLIRHGEAYISQHIGELTGPDTMDFYLESIDHLQKVLETAPERAACDLHPDYLSTRHAQGLGLPCVQVQHHHAHIGAVLAEHGLEQPVLGVVFDGAGFSGDNTVYGGEIYRADRSGFERLGHLAHLALPGGDRAAREPWRMALSLLHRAFGHNAFDENWQPAPLLAIAPETKALLGQLIDKGVNSPRTSSCGRLFDAVSGLLGLCLHADYEGQAAMLLEHQASLAAAEDDPPAYPVDLRAEEGMLVIESASIAPLIVSDLRRQLPTTLIARRFHHWLIAAVHQLLERLRQQTRLNTVVLTGGCMQNTLLFAGLVRRLEDHRFTVYSGEMVPVNDGGIALGQAFIGGAPPCV